MGQRPRSRASRSERRMLKERAERALKHGLPVPTPPPARARVPDVLGSRSSSVPPSGAGPSAASRRMPLAVKLLGIGLLLLGVIYGLTLFRDHHSEADAALPAAETDTSRAATKPLPVPAPAPIALPVGAGPSGADPTMFGAALHVPSARPPQLAPSAAKPTPAAPIVHKTAVMTANASPPGAPAPSAALPVPPSVAPSLATTPVAP
jgi:hypothetical protein